MPYIGNSPKNNVRGRFYYTATAAQTVFSGADSNGKTLAYQDGGYVDVYLNGVLLQDTTDYTATTKTSVTLTSGATAGDLVEIIAYGIFSVGDTVSAANGGTFKGNVAINADLTVDTDTLYVDSTNNRVGIGTASPTDELHIYKNTTDSVDLKIENSEGSATLKANNDSLYVDADNHVFRSEASSEYMRINSSGNLGIGTSSPTSKLQIRQGSNSNTAGIRVDENTAGNVYGALSASGTNTITLTAGSASSDSTTLRFLTASSGTEAEAMRIDSSGLIGINSSSTSSAGYVARLYINDTRTGSSESVLSLRHGSTGSNRPQIVFMNPNGAVGSVTTSGSATAYNTSSDYRLKENVVDLTGASDRVNQIPVHRFNFIADPDTTVDGFLAHEVQSVVPEAVTGTKDAMRDEEYEVTPAVLDDDGNVVTEAVMGTRSVPDHQGIDQSKLVPLLTAALQEALSEIADLKTRVAALETA